MSNDQVMERFNDLYERTVRGTGAYLLARCRARADLDDLVQETYVEVWGALKRQRLGSLRSDEAFVRHVAKQTLYRYYRAKVADTVPIPEAGDEGLMNAAAVEAWFERGVEDEVARKLLGERLRELLEEVPWIDRQIMTWYHRWEMNFREIAEALEWPESTVKSRYYRCLGRLKTRLEKEGYDGEVG